MSTPPAGIQFAGPTAGPPARSSDDHPSELTAAALSVLIPEWQLALRAEGKARGTIGVYTDGSRRYLAWCQSTDRAPIVRTSLQSWMAHLLDTGSAPGTVRIRHMAVRRFAAWLIATSRLRADPFVGVKGPVHRQAVVMPLSDDELRALIGTCTNPPAGSTSRSTTGEMRQSSG